MLFDSFAIHVSYGKDEHYSEISNTLKNMAESEFNDREFKIEAKGELPFASRIPEGYELISNDRTMKFVLAKKQARDMVQNVEKTYFSVDCFVREEHNWVKGDNGSMERSITDFVKKLDISPRFTKAIDEYRKQLNIKEEWR